MILDQLHNYTARKPDDKAVPFSLREDQWEIDYYNTLQHHNNTTRGDKQAPFMWVWLEWRERGRCKSIGWAIGEDGDEWFWLVDWFSLCSLLVFFFFFSFFKIRRQKHSQFRNHVCGNSYHWMERSLLLPISWRILWINADKHIEDQSCHFHEVLECFVRECVQFCFLLSSMLFLFFLFFYNVVFVLKSKISFFFLSHNRSPRAHTR